MPIKYNPYQKVRYTLEADRELPATDQVVFTFRTPRVRHRDRVQGILMGCMARQVDDRGEPVLGENGEQEVAADPHKLAASGLMTEILLCTLEGAENWDGVDLPTNGKGCVTLEGLELISPSDRAELANEAIKLLSITESDSD